MLRWSASYAALEILVVAVAIVVSLWRSRRRRRLRPVAMPAGFVRTEERLIDPTTGVEHVPWFDPGTGERCYQPLVASKGVRAPRGDCGR